jgi:type IV secretory pathway VirB10-like protein
MNPSVDLFGERGLSKWVETHSWELLPIKTLASNLNIFEYQALKTIQLKTLCLVIEEI